MRGLSSWVRDPAARYASYMRLLDKERRFGRWQAKRQLRLNTPVQGSAGDGFKYAVALLWERRHECPGNPKVVNLVHDEIVLEIDEEHAEAGKEWLERCMVDGMNEMAGADVPVSVEIHIGDSWADKGKVATAASVLSEATEPRAQTHPQLPGPASSDNGHYLAKEGLTATGYYEDDEPVRINLYLDYRGGTLANFPTIALCDECAEDLGGDVGELTELKAGEAGVCEMCGHGNAAAMLDQIL